MVHLYLLLYITASTQGTCGEIGAVELIGDYISSVGRVAICDGSDWGAICRDDWDATDAAVVCRELGYRADGKSLLAIVSN